VALLGFALVALNAYFMSSTYNMPLAIVGLLLVTVGLTAMVAGSSKPT
jgi:hypothetical protein